MKRSGVWKIAFLTFLFCFFAKEQVFALATNKNFSVPTPSPIEYSLPFPGLLPDHPLYPIKILRDRILLYSTRDEQKKVHMNLLFADKHAAMGQSLWDENEKDLAVETFIKGEEYLLNAAIGVTKLKHIPPGLGDKIELSAKKHEEMLKKNLEGETDENRKNAINKALGLNNQAKQQVGTIKPKSVN